MQGVPHDQAREAIAIELASLATRRRRTFAGTMGLLLLAAVLVTYARPEVMAGVLALYVSAMLTLSAGLAVPPLSRAGTHLLLGLAVGAAALAVVVTATPTGEDDGVELGCLLQGGLAGVLIAGAATLSFGPLWRKAIDVRWSVATFAGSVALLALAGSCPDRHALHLWLSHLPIIPAVYAGSRLAFGAALSEH